MKTAKILHKLTRKALLTLLALLLVAIMVPTTAFAESQVMVCSINGLGFSTLTEAFEQVKDGETIVLLADINHDSGIDISDKSITINLDGHILNVTVWSGTALHVSNGELALSDFTGGGELNLLSDPQYSAAQYGAHAQGNANITVTNVIGFERGTYADGDGASVTVQENVTAYENCAIAVNGSRISINENASSWGVSVIAEQASQVSIGCNLQNTIGEAVRASTGSSVSIGDNLFAGNAGTCVSATEGSQVLVGEDLVACAPPQVGGFIAPAATAPGIGIYASDSAVKIGNYLRCDNMAIVAYGSSMVMVGESVYAGGLAISTHTAEVMIGADIICTSGVQASDHSKIYVGGSIDASFDAVLVIGTNAMVNVGGDLSSANTGIHLTETAHYSTVTVAGAFTIPEGRAFIRLIDTEMSRSDYTTSIKTSYWQYSAESNTVWVKMTAAEELEFSRDQKTAALRALLADYSEALYTAQSWQAWQVAASATQAAIDSATTIDELAAIELPDAESILVRKPSVGAPGSGDLYATGQVSQETATLIARYICGSELVLTDDQFAAVDMDFDGFLTMVDVMLIMRRAMGL